jgi:lysophospholipase L1-like esterase
VGALAIQGTVLAGEIATRTFSPQEIAGWGERSSLQPHSDFGWRYKPNSSIHLRWRSYDYVITTNAEGFPGPLPADSTPADGTRRVLVTGDAFTSGEGLAPEQVWPRLLEAQLAATEVVNFAVTGYGPEQEAAVLSNYVPQYQPDVVIVQMFVNDFFDVMITDDEFRSRIGFRRQDPDALVSYLSGQNLRAWIRNEVIGNFNGASDRAGLNLANVDALANGAITPEMVSRVADNLEEIRLVTDAVGARLVVVMVPASAQSCDRRDLPYLPETLDLSSERFDLDQPQRLGAEAARTGGATEFYDLRPALAQGCLFQPHNMHLTAAGQESIAREIATILGSS